MRLRQTVRDTRTHKHNLTERKRAGEIESWRKWKPERKRQRERARGLDKLTNNYTIFEFRFDPKSSLID